MRPRIVGALFFCLAAVFSSSAQADLQACVEKLIDAPGSAQARVCLAHEVEQREKVLTKLERAIESGIRKQSKFDLPPTLQSFREAQVAWRKYRRTNCWIDASQATNADAVQYMCEATLADCRIPQLENILACLEGESCGA